MPRLSRALTLAACLALPVPALAQTVLSGDHSVDGNLCVGPSCTGSETFGGFDDLKLKSTGLGILFEDTGGTSAHDWRIRTNDTNEDSFWIEDVTDGTAPFKIIGTAPDNSLFVDGDGDVGLGTSMPRSPLHVFSENTTGIRLERANLTGGSANYELFMRDNGDFGIFSSAAGASPFVMDRSAGVNALVLDGDTSIFNLSSLERNFAVLYTQSIGTARSALYVDGTDGFVGIGTGTPQAPLHMVRADNSARVLVQDSGASGAQEMFKLSNNGGSFFTFENTASGTTWFFTHEDNQTLGNRFIIADAVADGPEFTLTAGGDLTIPGQLFTAGSCAAGCDRVFDEGYPLPTISEQATMMRDLKHLPNVGPTPEDGPFNITAMTGGMLNELEKAHLYIVDLHDTVALQAGAISLLQARIEALEAR